MVLNVFNYHLVTIIILSYDKMVLLILKINFYSPMIEIYGISINS